MQADTIGATVLLGGAALVASAFWLLKFARDRAASKMPLPAREEMAVIEEEISLTSWGKVSRLCLVLSVLWTFYVFAAAKSLVEQVGASSILYVGLLVFGAGMALGRRRTYRVYRTDPETKSALLE